MVHEVEIKEDSTAENVTAEDCHMKKDTNDEIKWINRTTKDCSIEFEKETPFKKGKNYTVKKNESEISGPLRGDVEKEHPYEYKLKAVIGTKIMAADPNVIIH